MHYSYSKIRQSPPNFLYGFSILDGVIQGLYWTAAVKYSFRIAPPTLVGTMAALTGSVNWIIGKNLYKIPTNISS